MGTILAIIVGWLTGMFVLRTLLDIIFFDIPFTQKIGKVPNWARASTIMGGSITSLLLWSIILIAVFSAFCYLSDAAWSFIGAAVVATLFNRHSKHVLLTAYRNKHYPNLSFRFVNVYLIENPETRLVDYDASIELIDSYVAFYK